MSSARLAAAHALAAAAGAAAVVWFGPPGVDLAAHVYQRALFLQHGFSLWNNYWYAGRYSYVTYSLLYYPLAALVGIKLLALLSAATAAAAFALLVDREWPAVGRWPARAFTAASAASVVTGAFPYALGFAFALCALVALRSTRRWPFAPLVVLTFLASPLAFALLAVVLASVGAAFAHRSMARPAAVVIATMLAGGVLWRAFPNSGRFPFSPAEFAASLAFCAVGIAFTWRVPAARVLWFFFCIYALACTAAFAIPSQLGENVARLRFVAVPIAVLALALRRWRPLLPALGALALAVSWNVTPLASAFANTGVEPSSQRAYWRPVVRYLHTSLTPSYRVEVVDTSGHWGADYLARAGIPIARGWFRQDDFPQNRVLYRNLGARAYLRWLHRMSIAYVVLTDAPADYSARAERALLRSGRSGLRLVFRSAHARVYAVPNPRSIISGPGRARVVALQAASAVFAVTRPGRYRVVLRYSPYWSATAACVRPGRDGMISLFAHRAGRIHLRFTVTAERAVATAAGVDRAC